MNKLGKESKRGTNQKHMPMESETQSTIQEKLSESDKQVLEQKANEIL